MWLECGLSLLLVAGVPQVGKREQRDAFEALALQAKDREPERRRSAVRALAEFLVEQLPPRMTEDWTRAACERLVRTSEDLRLLATAGLGAAIPASPTPRHKVAKKP